LKGNYHLNIGEYPEAPKNAAEYFQKTIKVDSNFAKPYAGLIYGYGYFTYYSDVLREEGISKIRYFIKKSLELDENLPEAHAGMAAFNLWQLWEWEEAGNAFRRAIEINPNLSGMAGCEYVWYLTVMGYSSEAIVQAEHLLQLDPLSYITRKTVNFVYYCMRQYDKAITLCQRTIESDPDESMTYSDLAANYDQLEMYDDAHKSRLFTLKLSGIAPEIIAAYDSLYYKLGPTAYPTWLLMAKREQKSWSEKGSDSCSMDLSKIG
jgi:tetratricopeptide (TPR) repeat protein